MTLPPLQKPTIVLFDMDGTTVRHVNPRLLGILEFLDDIAYKTGRIFRRTGGPVTPPLETAPVTPVKKRKLPVHRTLHRIRRKPVEQIVQPCPGIYAVLNLLQEHNIPMGIVSNGLGKGYGHDILKKFHLDRYFTARIFREDIQKSKPHPDPLLRALNALRDPPRDDDIVWYIGDRHKDVMAALAADRILPCRFLPFSYGLQAAMAILEKGLGPDRIIVSYHEFATRTKALLENTQPLPQNTDQSKNQYENPASKSARSAS